jgi:hypothetical protein
MVIFFPITLLVCLSLFHSHAISMETQFKSDLSYTAFGPLHFGNVKKGKVVRVLNDLSTTP